MADLYFQKSMDCAENLGILVFWVADFENELHNSKINVADTKWWTFCLNFQYYFENKISQKKKKLMKKNLQTIFNKF